LKRAHLPPAIAVDVILLQDLYTVSSLQVDFVGIFGNELEQRVDIFRHISYHGGNYSRGFGGYSAWAATRDKPRGTLLSKLAADR